MNYDWKLSHDHIIIWAFADSTPLESTKCWWIWRSISIVPFTLASKNPESFVHSGFSWEVARQLPLNTAKNPNRKTHLRSGIFWNSAGFSGVFANVNACSNLAGYYLGFWSHGTWPSAESPDRGPRRNAHYTCTVKVERSRACAPLTKTPVWDSGVFAHALFVPKTPNVMGFSGSVNGTTKNPGFLDIVFLNGPIKSNVNGPKVLINLTEHFIEILRLSKEVLGEPYSSTSLGYHSS